MRLYTILLFTIYVHGLNLPKTWNKVTLPFKGKARNWFIERAENLGIPWSKLHSYYASNVVSERLNAYKDEVIDNDMIYPNYYTKPFHGYDEGNLNWLAAYENEAATLNIAAGYWPDVKVGEAQQWMRQNTTGFIQNYLNHYNFGKFNYQQPLSHNYSKPRRLADIGCSIGMSSEFQKQAFPDAKIWGVDLSPYFLAVAKYRSAIKNQDIEYIHENAEKMSFQSNYFDVVTCNYLFHEVPEEATKNILNEIYRIVEPNGIVAITDIEPSNINQKKGFLTPFRRWMFEVTEPHIFAYYDRDMRMQLLDAGFTNVVKQKNDPVNSVWIGQKICES